LRPRIKHETVQGGPIGLRAAHVLVGLARCPSLGVQRKPEAPAVGVRNFWSVVLTLA
jgi:hypothetical protein